MRPGRAVLAVALATTLAAGGAAAVTLRPDPPPPPPTLRLGGPAPLPPALLPVAEAAPVPSASGVARAVAAAVGSRALGATPAATVVDVATGAVLLDVGADRAVVPASTAKIVTAVAALSTLDPATRLTTTVVRGSAPGSLVLVGGGDPTLRGPVGEGPTEGGSLADLVEQVAAAGITRVSSLSVDAGVYSGPVLGPGWKPGYVTSGDVAPVVGLMTDGGRTTTGADTRSAEPDLLAGRQLLALLAARGVEVPATVTRGTAPAGADPVATTRSAPVPVLVEQMLRTSDNDLAEALGRTLAVAAGRPASFSGTAAGLLAGVAAFDLPAGSVALVDASGLSPDDRLQPRAVAALLLAAASADHPALRPLVSGLPVAGFAGTLEDRYRTGPAAAAAGLVRAKTGTLSGVSALAGLVVDADGRLLAFDLTADGVAPDGGSTLAARKALDELAAVLATCGCG